MRHLFYAIVNNRVNEEGFKIYEYHPPPQGHIYNYRLRTRLKDLIGNQFVDFDPKTGVHQSLDTAIVNIHYYGTLEVIYQNIGWQYSPYADGPYLVSTIKFLKPLR